MHITTVRLVASLSMISYAMLNGLQTNASSKDVKFNAAIRAADVANEKRLLFAISTARAARNKEKEAEAAYDLGMHYFKLKKWNLAAKHFETTLQYVRPIYSTNSSTLLDLQKKNSSVLYQRGRRGQSYRYGRIARKNKKLSHARKAH